MGTTREASNWKYSVPQPSESCEPPPVPDVAKTPLVSVRHIPRAFAPNSPVIFLIASPCWTPRAALFPPCPRKKSPRRSGVLPPRTANSSGYASRALEKGSGLGADQVARSHIHRAGFDVPCGFCPPCFRPLKYGTIGIFNATIKHPMTKKIM